MHTNLNNEINGNYYEDDEPLGVWAILAIFFFGLVIIATVGMALFDMMFGVDVLTEVLANQIK